MNSINGVVLKKKVLTPFKSPVISQHMKKALASLVLARFNPVQKSGHIPTEKESMKKKIAVMF